MAEPRGVDLLIIGAEVLTFDDAARVVRDGAIAIAGNEIVWVGTRSEAASLFRAKAVSYTHLDVYKRQLIRWSGSASV